MNYVRSKSDHSNRFRFMEGKGTNSLPFLSAVALKLGDVKELLEAAANSGLKSGKEDAVIDSIALKQENIGCLTRL